MAKDMTDKRPIGPNSAMWSTVHLRWNNGTLEQLWQDANGFAPNEWRPVPTVTPKDAT